MNSINLYNPTLYNKQAGLKRKPEVRFSGYGKMIEIPCDFTKNICAKSTPDSVNCLGFLLRKVGDNQELRDSINFLNNKKIINYSETKPLTKAERSIKQQLIRQNVIDRDGNILDRKKAREIINYSEIRPLSKAEEKIKEQLKKKVIKQDEAGNTVIDQEKLRRINELLLKRIVYDIKLQKTKQQLINLNILKQDGTIIGLNKIKIKDGTDKLPDLNYPDTTVEISGGVFGPPDRIEGDHVILRKNVQIPGVIKANTLEMRNNTHVNIVEKADAIDASGNSIIDFAKKVGFARIFDKAKLLGGNIKGWLIEKNEAVVKNTIIGNLRISDNASAINFNTDKIIAHGSPTLDHFSAKQIERFSDKIKESNCRSKHMVNVNYFKTPKPKSSVEASKATVENTKTQVKKPNIKDQTHRVIIERISPVHKEISQIPQEENSFSLPYVAHASRMLENLVNS